MKLHIMGILLVGTVATVVAPAAFAQSSPPSAERGRSLFQQKCQPCHGTEPSDMGHAMLPGTDALRIKYRGALPAAIEQRKDLTPEAIKVYVRRGTWSMPPFRKTELSDGDIADIAAWIRKTAGG
ncbi:MAG: Cytochrome c6 [Pseudomonadota bacterium]